MQIDGDAAAVGGRRNRLDIDNLAVGCGIEIARGRGQRDGVGISAAINGVGTGEADEGVVAAAALEIVDAVAANEIVVAAGADQRIA